MAKEKYFTINAKDPENKILDITYHEYKLKGVN